MNTPKINATNAIDDFVSFVNQFQSLYLRAKDLAERQSVHDYVTIWKAQTTYTVNADGSQGASDPAPNNDHPILDVHQTANNLTAITSYLVADLISLVENGTPVQADRRPAINNVLA